MSLRNQLKDKRGLFSTSSEELGSLRQKVVSPQENAVTGGSPDTAKMAGTPEQKKSAIRAGIEGARDLQTFQRQGGAQAQADMTEQDTAAAQKAQQLADLGQLGQNLPDIVAERFSLDTITPSTLEVLTGLDLDEELKTKITTSPADLDDADFLAIAKELGVERTDEMSDNQFKNQVKAKLKMGDTSVAEQVAADIAGEVTMSELTGDDLGDLGFESEEEMAEALGVDPAELGGMSLNQVQQIISEIQSSMFDQAAEARHIIADPTSSAAEVKAAQNALDRFSKLGIEDVEVQVNDIQRQIEEGKTFQFDGKIVKLDELLDSDKLEIKVMQALTDDEEMAKLAATEPELHSFIIAHKEAFEELVGELDTQLSGFVELNEANSAQAVVEDLGIEMTEDEMNLLHGFDGTETSFGDVRDVSLDEPPVVTYLNDTTIPAESRQAVHYFLQQVSTNNYKQLGDELRSLSLDEITKLGFNNKQAVGRYINNYEMTQAISSADLTTSTGQEEFANNYLGGGTDSLKGKLSEIFTINASGFGNIKSADIQLLDANNDGKLDSFGDIANRLKERGPSSLRNLLNAGKKLNDTTSPTVGNINIKQPSSPVYAKVKDAFADGRVSMSESIELTTKLDKREIEELLNTSGSRIGWREQGSLKHKLNTEAKKRAQEHYKWHMQQPDMPQVPAGPYGISNMTINSVDDLLRAHKEINREIERIKSGRAGGDEAARYRWINEHAAKRHQLHVVAKHLAKRTTTSKQLPHDTNADQKEILRIRELLQKVR